MYYLRQLDWMKFRLFLNHTKKITKKSSLRIWLEIIHDSLTENISILEYFQFKFYMNRSREYKSQWAGTGYMYEFQKKQNPIKSRVVLDDKRLFKKKYSQFIKHKVYTIKEIQNNNKSIAALFDSDIIVLKQFNGKCGLGIEFVKAIDFTKDGLVNYMLEKGHNLAESFVRQHPLLNELSSSGVNTVRIFTQINKSGGVDILGCRQRITLDSNVDNLAAGNIAAAINPNTGIIDRPGVYSGIKENESIHPVTGVVITGFKIPYWKECISLATEAALFDVRNKSIGWDIVVTAEGPGLIEGNHDWCKLLWQLPVEKGLKSMLKKYL